LNCRESQRCASSSTGKGLTTLMREGSPAWSRGEEAEH
jgi:hypothetical protein